MGQIPATDVIAKKKKTFQQQLDYIHSPDPSYCSIIQLESYNEPGIDYFLIRGAMHGNQFHAMLGFYLSLSNKNQDKIDFHPGC